MKREENDDPANQNRRSAKEEGPGVVRNHRNIKENRNRKAKYICPNHMEKYLFRCEFEGCTSPYICPNGECLYDHFHTDHLILTKFDSNKFKNNYMKAQEIINNTETMFIKAKQIKNVIDEFKGKLADLFQDLSTMTAVCEGLKS